MTTRILLVDDEATFRERFCRALERAGHHCTGASDVASAMQVIAEIDFDVAFLDIRLPDGSGLNLLKQLSDRCPQTAVVMVTAYAGLESAVEALRQGAVDYLAKPFQFDEALHRLARLLEYREMQIENQLLRRELSGRSGCGEIVGESALMQDVHNLIARVAPTWSTVLITGESGTGKELVARAIHRSGPTQGARFVPVNCAAIPSELLESELFGHERGAFTGASRTKLGLFELANGGTLFLDEIAELPLALQAKLLRALETQEIVRVGSTRLIRLHARVLVATNCKLAAEVGAGRFREDLYYRVRVVEIELPPLRSRPEDIPLLARHCLERHQKRLKRPCRGISNAAMRYLMTYPWPGNVRELDNVMERAIILGRSDWIEAQDLPGDLTTTASAVSENLRTAVHAYERQHIRAVLAATGGDRTFAAQRLGIGLSSLYRKLHELGIPLTSPETPSTAAKFA